MIVWSCHLCSFVNSKIEDRSTVGVMGQFISNFLWKCVCGPLTLKLLFDFSGIELRFHVDKRTNVNHLYQRIRESIGQIGIDFRVLLLWC